MLCSAMCPSSTLSASSKFFGVDLDFGHRKLSRLLAGAGRRSQNADSDIARRVRDDRARLLGPSGRDAVDAEYLVFHEQT